MKPLIAGNWKMNKTAAEAMALVETIHEHVGRIAHVGIALCPPFTLLDRLAQWLETANSNIQLGAQNMHPEPGGAYTGEVAANMLRDFFCTYVIVGHSERRQYFEEDNAFINRKVRAALDNHLKPILCIGETLEEREQGQTLNVVTKQLQGCLGGITPPSADELVIAYEPVWAIGTGKTATPEAAQEVHAAIRNWLTETWHQAMAEKIRLLYGGSMKPTNAAALMEQPDINGGLIGGASLNAEAFIALVKIAENDRDIL